jgi:hypothetical protein
MKNKFMTLAFEFINADNEETRFAKRVELNNLIVTLKITITERQMESIRKRSVIDSINNYNGTDTNKVLLIKLFEGFENLIID